MFFWLLTAALAALLATVAVLALRRSRSQRARGRWLSGLGALAVLLYTAIAIWPWRPAGDPSSLFVFAALPIGFIPQTVGAIWCLKLIVAGPETKNTGDWVCIAGNLLLLLGYLACFLVLGGNFYVLAVIPGACLIALVMWWVYFALQREEQRA